MDAQLQNGGRARENVEYSFAARQTEYTGMPPRKRGGVQYTVYADINLLRTVQRKSQTVLYGFVGVIARGDKSLARLTVKCKESGVLSL